MQNTFKIDEVREDISSTLAYILAQDDSENEEDEFEKTKDSDKLRKKDDISKFLQDENLNLDGVDIPDDFILNDVPLLLQQMQEREDSDRVFNMLTHDQLESIKSAKDLEKVNFS